MQEEIDDVPRNSKETYHFTRQMAEKAIQNEAILSAQRIQQQARPRKHNYQELAGSNPIQTQINPRNRTQDTTKDLRGRIIEVTENEPDISYVESLKQNKIHRRTGRESQAPSRRQLNRRMDDEEVVYVPTNSRRRRFSTTTSTERLSNYPERMPSRQRKVSTETSVQITESTERSIRGRSRARNSMESMEQESSETVVKVEAVADTKSRRLPRTSTEDPSRRTARVDLATRPREGRSRGNVKAKVTDGNKKSKSANVDEIDESDNYPEPFKALLSKKKVRKRGDFFKTRYPGWLRWHLKMLIRHLRFLELRVLSLIDCSFTPIKVGIRGSGCARDGRMLRKSVSFDMARN